jgi:hypothetical protein
MFTKLEAVMKYLHHKGYEATKGFRLRSGTIFVRVNTDDSFGSPLVDMLHRYFPNSIISLTTHYDWLTVQHIYPDVGELKSYDGREFRPMQPIFNLRGEVINRADYEVLAKERDELYAKKQAANIS